MTVHGVRHSSEYETSNNPMVQVRLKYENINVNIPRLVDRSRCPYRWMCLKMSLQCIILCGIFIRLFAALFCWLQVDVIRHCFAQLDKVPDTVHHTKSCVGMNEWIGNKVTKIKLLQVHFGVDVFLLYYFKILGSSIINIHLVFPPMTLTSSVSLFGLLEMCSLDSIALMKMAS